MASTSSAKVAHSGGGITRLTRSYSSAERARAVDFRFAIYTCHEHILAYTYPEHNRCQVRESGSLVPTTARSASTPWRNRNSLGGLPTVSAAIAPVSSTSCCCSIRRRKFCL